MTFAAILQLIAGLTPAVGNIIMLFKDSTGNTTALISSAQTATAADIAQMQAYLTAHQAGTTAAAPKLPASS
jgi:hypothetical protein